ncbi:hypothetical protein FV226_24350 [Methylobacterium sp. WL12]|nr:hypothetical protein FV226_24350 [Methylobacterium sp. WL12]
MRELPVLLSDGTVDPAAAGIIQACMLYPDDTASIEDYISVFRMRLNRNFRKSKQGELNINEWRSAQLGGEMAGTVVLKIAQFHRHMPSERVLINKGIHLVFKETEETGAPIAKKHMTILGYWSKYKDVSHIWAGIGLAQAFEAKITGSNASDISPDIKMAAEFAEQIADLVAPLLKGWSPWRFPKAFPRESIDFQLPEPNDDDIRWLRTYRAAQPK